MDAANIAFARPLIGAAYAEQGGAALRRRAGLVRALLTQRALPAAAWSEAEVEALLGDLAAMDSNNFAANVGAGEREARVFSSLVRRRALGLAHGVGRSGDVAAVQPKAAGSSLLYALTNALALSAARLCGLRRTKAVLVLPLATGMALALVLRALAPRRPAGARFVVWCRIDQKSCLKAILTAGFTPVVVEMARGARSEAAAAAAQASQAAVDAEKRDVAGDAGAAGSSVAAAVAGADALAGTAGAPSPAPASAPLPAPAAAAAAAAPDAAAAAAAAAAAIAAAADRDELRTDVAAVAAAIARLGAENVLCVVTTSSCFAPRAPDDVVAVAALCARVGVAHVVNHAYGLQSAPACHALNEACRGDNGGGGNGAAGAGDGAAGGGGGDGAAGGASSGASGDGGGGGGGGGHRVDAWVASTDKNFMVPVGGALVGSPLPDVVEAVSRAYPGRASAAPVVDLFITLLQMGQPGLQALLAQRRRVFARLLAAMEGVAARCGERVLRSPRNAVSIAMTIDSITAAPPPGAGAGAGEGGGDDAASAGAASGGLGGSGGGDSVVGSAAGGGGSRAGSGAPGGAATYLGSMLFSRGVSGTRVVAPGERRAVGPLSFVGYGASCDDYGCAYLTAAAGIGMTEADVDDFAERLESTIREYRRQAVAAAAPSSVRGGGAGGAGRSDAAAR